jgi:hypothetical protein
LAALDAATPLRSVERSTTTPPTEMPSVTEPGRGDGPAEA